MFNYEEREAVSVLVKEVDELYVKFTDLGAKYRKFLMQEIARIEKRAKDLGMPD